MSFQTGLSGLNAASRNLDVIGNNIANANTTGMKASRTEFADIVAASTGGTGGNAAGIGVEVAAVTQQFSQGNINITGRDLDLAINGGGFFQLEMPDGTAAYTRDGSFKLDKTGNLVTNKGAHVMGYPTDLLGVATSTTIQRLQLPTSAPIAANQTTAIVAEFNLDARAPVAASVVPPTPRTTYGTSLTAYDSQGVALPVNLYFERVATTGTDNWDVYDVATGGAPVGQLNFDATGTLVSSSLATLTLTPLPPSIVPAFSPTVDVTNATQYGAGFSVSNLTQDGYAPGEFVGLKIGPDGVIVARYSNGETQAGGQVSLADFRNVQGLTPTGGGNWIESSASGQPIQGAPGQGKLGALNAGALEESNVDVTEELINMMTAQRAYQANAQTIKTQDQVLSTLVNLR
ncbi:flagellar hook protein FlgE [Rhodoferax sp.]|uniref:flagellar hook protein FlgE n=1 Tax=Rhodoferax sp. TaxID=50421 RepID=UPI001EB0E726|nr:flagellar hook protein FlgE [Rhodoferax sp.]MBT9507708.1 flagellar hook protein FlgE [Rhodoferax sp.]